MLPSHSPANPVGDQASMISLPRLPPISSLLAGLDPRDQDKEQHSSASYGSLPNPHTFSNWDNASPFGRQSNHPSHSAATAYPPAYPPSSKSTRLAALAPITTGAIHHQYSTSSVRGSVDSNASTSSPSSMQPPQPRRLPSMQLISPTGGPLHPLPSGLVGFPPINSPSQSERISHPPSPVFRARSNSVTSHPYAGPYFGSGRRDRTESFNGERRTSVGWMPQDQQSQMARLRKRTQEPTEGGDRQQRPRTASISSAEESRNVPGWADTRDNMGVSLNSSSQSSPVESARRGSVDASAALSRRSSDDSQRSHPEAASDRSDVSPRLSGRPTHHLAPELAALHITSPESWRGLTSQASVSHQRLGPSIHAPTSTPALPPYSTWAPGPMSVTSGPLPPSSTSNSVFSGTPALDDGIDAQNEVGRYGCPHCPKRFARPSSLRTHIHSHTGEKPFSCDQCGRGFSVQSNLRRHLKIHRGQPATGTSTPSEKAGGSKRRAADGAASDEDMLEAGGSPSEGEGSEGKVQ